MTSDEFVSRIWAHWRTPPAGPEPSPATEAVESYRVLLERLLLEIAPRNNRIVRVSSETIAATVEGSQFFITGETCAGLRSLWLLVVFDASGGVYIELKMSDGSRDARDLEFGKDVGTSPDNPAVLSAVVLSAIRLFQHGYREITNVPAPVESINPKTGKPRQSRALGRLYRSIGFEDRPTADGDVQVLNLSREDLIRRLAAFSFTQLARIEKVDSVMSSWESP